MSLQVFCVIYYNTVIDLVNHIIISVEVDSKDKNENVNSGYLNNNNIDIPSTKLQVMIIQMIFNWLMQLRYSGNYTSN